MRAVGERIKAVKKVAQAVIAVGPISIAFAYQMSQIILSFFFVFTQREHDAYISDQMNNTESLFKYSSIVMCTSEKVWSKANSFRV